MIKTTETVIYDRRKTQQDTPPPLPGITRVDTLRVRRVVSECSQTLYALRELRHHGLTDAGLHTVFRSVVVAKLLYASSAWSGFITASDRHRVDAFLRRSRRSGYCQPDLPSFDELLEDTDDKLFNKLCNNSQHSHYYLLPLPKLTSQHYYFRPTSSHNRQLPTRSGHLADANFITRLLYKDAIVTLFAVHCALSFPYNS